MIRSKDLFLASREAEETELETPLRFLCTKCNTPWARLHSQEDEEGHESYEYCPKCYTDSHLVKSYSHEAFIFCKITGKIKNIITGEYVEEKVNTVFPKSKSTPYEKWMGAKDREDIYFRTTKERREAENDRKIEEYRKQFS